MLGEEREVAWYRPAPEFDLGVEAVAPLSSVEVRVDMAPVRGEGGAWAQARVLPHYGAEWRGGHGTAAGAVPALQVRARRARSLVGVDTAICPSVEIEKSGK